MDTIKFKSINADEFRRGITRIVIAALVLVPVSGIVIMTFVGIYPWPQLLAVLYEFSGIVIVLNVIGILWFTRRVIDRVVQVVEQGTQGQREKLELQFKERLPQVFFGFLFLYTLQGAFSANLSLSFFHGYDYGLTFYIYTFYGMIPVFLIATFPIYFYLTDFLGRYVAPKGVHVTVAPLGLKLTILGLFTPLMIDTLLLLYYFDRTHYLSFETIALWFVLVVIASFGTLVAWRSMRQSLAPFSLHLGSMEQGESIRVAAPVSLSLDEIGALTNRYARLLRRNQSMEDGLAYERSFVNAVLENARALVLVQDPEGRIYRFNRACEELTGRKFEEVQGKFVWDLFLDPEEADDVRDNTFKALVKNPRERSGRYVNSWVLPGKGRRTIDWSKSALLDADGNTEFVVSIGIDITDKAKSENALIRSNELQTAQIQIAHSLESAKNHVDVIDAVDAHIKDLLGYSGCWLYMVDPGAEKYTCNLVSKTRDLLGDAENLPLVDRVGTKDSALLKMMFETGEPAIIEDARIDPRTNKTISAQAGWRTVVSFPLTLKGEPIGFFGVGTFGDEGVRMPDPEKISFLRTLCAQIAIVCDRIDYERKLAESNDELEQRVEERTRELQEAQEELVRSERLTVLGQLTATVSHELRNPLGSMRPSAYVLRKKLADHEDQSLLEAIERIERGIDRCDRIIEELLDFTRASRLQKSPTRLDQWLEFSVQEQSFPDAIEVSLSTGLDGLRVNIDSFRMRRVLVNILENAIQSLTSEEDGKIKAGARIDISSGLEQDKIKIRCADNGPGIAQDVLPHIFEPLFSTKNFGVGLGMPAVKQIMELHGGGIQVDSVEGKGTTITLWLPRSASGAVVSNIKKAGPL
ncbi:MAG: PAS domain-containing sensor histidine kinase [Acidiferrobacterales bacterium]